MPIAQEQISKIDYLPPNAVKYTGLSHKTWQILMGHVISILTFSIIMI